MALRFQGTYNLRVFALMKEMRDRTYGDNLFGSEDLIYQPVMSIFLGPF